jgi:hypothetical protein
MRSHGAKSVPVVSRGTAFTYAQVLSDVSDFLGIDPPEGGELSPAELVEKLDVILAAAQRLCRQMPTEKLAENVRNRKRTLGHLCNHIFRIPQCFLDAAEGGELTYELLAMPPEPWMKTGADIARFGDPIRERAKTWWTNQVDVECLAPVRTYFGDRPMYEVLERTCWHSAQHVRQIALMLEDFGIVPDGALTPHDLKGLPMPEKAWDDE